MSRNPIVAFTHRGGFRLGQVEFKDFLWEAMLDTAPMLTMGGTAEGMARRYDISREDADRFAELSFQRALAAQQSCFLSGEIVPLVNEKFELNGYHPRGLRLSMSKMGKQDPALSAWRRTRMSVLPRSTCCPKFRRPSAACRRGVTAPPLSMEPLRPWSPPVTTLARIRNLRWPESPPLLRLAFLPRIWASGPPLPFARCWRLPVFP